MSVRRIFPTVLRGRTPQVLCNLSSRKSHNPLIVIRPLVILTGWLLLTPSVTSVEMKMVETGSISYFNAWLLQLVRLFVFVLQYRGVLSGFTLALRFLTLLP